MEEEKRIREARRIANNLKIAIECLNQDYQKRIAGIKKMASTLDDLLRYGEQSKLGVTIVDNKDSKVEKWLKETKNFKTYDDLLKWIGHKDPSVVEKVVYLATYQRYDIHSILEIGKNCLTDKQEVIRDG